MSALTDEGCHFRPPRTGRFPHLIQLARDVAQRQTRIRDGDRRHDLHEVILWRPARRARQQIGVRELFSNHAMDGAAQPLDRPIMAFAIDNPSTGVPAMLRATLLHHRKPGPRRRDQLIEMDLASGGGGNSYRFGHRSRRPGLPTTWARASPPRAAVDLHVMDVVFVYYATVRSPSDSKLWRG